MAKILRNTTFQIQELTVITRSSEYDLLPNLMNFALFRSMDNVVGSGYVNLVEDLNRNGSFRKLAGLNGLEGIRITITPNGSNDGATQTFFFIIYSLDNVQIVNDKRFYTLRFTEPFGIANSFMRIGMKYANVKCSDAVKQIGEATNTSHSTSVLLGFCNVNNGLEDKIFSVREIEDSQNNINFLVPMWHPLKAMLYFGNSACTNKYGTDNIADCVLFTDHKGKFCLMSLGSLFRGKLGTIEFNYGATNIQGDGSNDKETRYNINQLSLSSIYNIQDFAKLGMLGKRLYEADLYTLAGSQNEKQLGVPQLKPAGDDLGTGVYPYKDFTFNEIRDASGNLYMDNKELDFETFVAEDYLTPDHLYDIVYYNGTNDKSEKVLETIIEPRDLRGTPVKNMVTYFKISIKIPLDTTLDVGASFTIKCNDPERTVDEIDGMVFVICSVAHYFTLINAYTMVEAFSVPSGIVKPSQNKQFASPTLGQKIKASMKL